MQLIVNGTHSEIGVNVVSHATAVFKQGKEQLKSKPKTTVQRVTENLSRRDFVTNTIVQVSIY